MRFVFIMLCLIATFFSFSQLDSLHVSRYLPKDFGVYPYKSEIKHLAITSDITGEESEIKRQLKCYPYTYDDSNRIVINPSYVDSLKIVRYSNFNSVYRSEFNIQFYSNYIGFNEDIPPFIDTVQDGVYVVYYKRYPYADGDTIKFYENRIASIFNVKNLSHSGNAYWFTIDGQRLYKSGKYEQGKRVGEWFLSDVQPNDVDAYEIRKVYSNDIPYFNSYEDRCEFREKNKYPSGFHDIRLVVRGDTYEQYVDSILVQKCTDSIFEKYIWRIPITHKLFKSAKDNRQLIEKLKVGSPVEISEDEFLNRNNSFFTKWRDTLNSIEEKFTLNVEKSYFLNNYYDKVDPFTGEVTYSSPLNQFDFSEYESYYLNGKPMVLYRKTNGKEKLEIFNEQNRSIFSRIEVDSFEVLKYNKHYFDTIKSKVFKNYFERSYDEVGKVLTFHIKSYRIDRGYFNDVEYNNYKKLLVDQDVINPSFKLIDGRLHKKIENEYLGNHYEYIQESTEKYKEQNLDSLISLYSCFNEGNKLKKSIEVNFQKKEVYLTINDSIPLKIKMKLINDSILNTELTYAFSNGITVFTQQNCYDFYKWNEDLPTFAYLSLQKGINLIENLFQNEKLEKDLNHIVSEDIAYYFDHVLSIIHFTNSSSNNRDFIIKKDGKPLSCMFFYNFSTKSINLNILEHMNQNVSLSASESAFIFNEIQKDIYIIFDRSDTNFVQHHLPSSKRMSHKEIVNRLKRMNPYMASIPIRNGRFNGKLTIINDNNEPIKTCFIIENKREGEDVEHQFMLTAEIVRKSNFVNGLEEGLSTITQYSKEDTMYTEINYLHGKPHGRYENKSTSNNFYYFENYKNGKLDGEKIDKYIIEDTVYTTSNFKLGVLHGKYSNRKVNAKEEEVYYYKDGKLDGPVYKIKEKDTIVTERYKNGLNDSLLIYNEEYSYHTCIEKVSMREGLKHGAFEVFDSKMNNLLIKGNYWKDTLNGQLTFFHKNGKRKALFNLKNGEFIDTSLFYDTLGSLSIMHVLDHNNFVKEFKYVNGKILSVISLDSNVRYENGMESLSSPLKYTYVVIDQQLGNIDKEFIVDFLRKNNKADVFYVSNYSVFTYVEENSNEKIKGHFDKNFCINQEMNSNYFVCSESKKIGPWIYSPKKGNPYQKEDYLNSLILPCANRIDSIVFYPIQKITQYANKRKSKVLWEKYVIENTSLYNCGHKETYEINTYYIAYEQDSSMHLRNGYQKNYYPNGVLQSEGMNKAGLPTGGWKFYNDNGSLREAGNYKDGKRVGRWLAGDLSKINYLGDICMDMNDPRNVALQKELENQLDIEEAFYESGYVVSRNYLSVRK